VSGDVHLRLSLLWLLQTLARYHAVFHLVVTMETRVLLWKQLVELIRKILDRKLVDVKESAGSKESEIGISKVTEKKELKSDCKKSRKRKHMPLDTDDEKPETDEKTVQAVRDILDGNSPKENLSSESDDLSFVGIQSVAGEKEGVQLDFRSLVFENHLEEEGQNLVLQQTQSVLAAILVSMDTARFRDMLRELEHDMVRLENCNYISY